MANQPGGGGFDPRYNNGRYDNNAQYSGQQYNAYYDPRYQQQPYPYQAQNVQVQVPMGGFQYNGVQQQQQQPIMQPSPTFSHHSPTAMHQPSPILSHPSPGLNQRSYQSNQQQAQQHHMNQLPQIHHQPQQHQQRPPQQYQPPQPQHQTQQSPLSAQPQQFYNQAQYRQQQLQSPKFPSPQIPHAQTPPQPVHSQQRPPPSQPAHSQQRPPPSQPAHSQQRQAPPQPVISLQRQVPPQPVHSQQRHAPSPKLLSHSPPLHPRQSPSLAQQRSPLAPHDGANGHVPSPKLKRPPAPQQPQRATPPTRPAPPPVVLPPPLDIDYAKLLLDLADRFFDEAYQTQDGKGRQRDPDIFAKLVANGLACLDAVLKKHRTSLQPSQEAAVRLRYASILCGETQNYMDAEEMLSKGISLCERYRFTAYKYNMQHLLARVTYSKNPKAAARYADGLIRDVEAVHHTPWLYAFRFLRVALGLRIGTNQEILNATTQLRLITNFATSRKHPAMAATAAATEALLHLMHSTGNESIEQAQRALASSRKSQLDPSAQSIRQLTAMTLFIDLVCSLIQNHPNESTAKMVEMNKFLDENAQANSWGDDGEFLVPIPDVQGSEGAASAGGIVHLDEDGHVLIRVRWMPKDEIYALAYLMSGSTMMHKNAQDGGKAEAFLKEANGLLVRSQKRSGPVPNPWEKALACHLRLQQIFALCGRSAWQSARDELNKVRSDIDGLPEKRKGILPVFAAFFDAVILQGTGDTAKALELYLQPPLSIYTTDLTHASPAHHDIALLSALNALMIVCIPSHPDHGRASTLISTVEPLASEHPSKDIQAAYHLIRAVSLNASAAASETSAESASMLKTKQSLQNALQLAKRTANNQLCCITLNFMSYKYFRGVVGPQAQKSASSAEALAKKGQDSLWTSVAHGLLAETLDTQGKNEEAEKTLREGLEEAKRLPKAMWRRGEEPGL